MTHEQLLNEFLLVESIANSTRAIRSFPAQPGSSNPLPVDLTPPVTHALTQLGIAHLYDHQRKAYELLRAGQDVVVATGTSSGKSLCYNLPILQGLSEEPVARALYLYPTKALAQDQLGKLADLSRGLDFRVATFDGDTPKSQRAAIRKSAQVVLTNPDMLHLGILPQHETWRAFLRSLRYIVLDEMHTYRGVFGSHCAWVLRRLLRLCAWYGTRPQIVATSATVAEPELLFTALTGRTAELIEIDGSPQGQRTLFLVGSLEGQDDPDSGSVRTAALVTSLAQRGIKTMVFCRARSTTETVLRMVRKRLGSPAAERVESYRGGYTAEQRRSIEQRFFRDDLVALITTNAMELGVDVGALDSVVMNGLPTSIASFWQQVGRAGRGGRDSVSVAIARDDPREQFLLAHPDLMVGAPIEPVVIAPQNPHIARQQLRCAAHERPISPDELVAMGVGAPAMADELVDSGDLQWSAGRYFYPSHDSPAGNVNLRGGGADVVTLLVGTTPLGTMERWRATMEAHEHAIYLHQGQSYRVVELDLRASVVRLVREDTELATQAVAQTVVEPRVVLGFEEFRGFRLELVSMDVTTAVVGYRVLDGRTGAPEQVHPLDLPAQTLRTVGLHLRIPVDFEQVEMGLAQAIHGVEHALGSLAPIFAGCDPSDLGTAWYSIFPDTLQGAVFLFDSFEGGLGLCERLLRSSAAWMEAAFELIAKCDCAEGCPRCLMSSRCEGQNRELDKAGTLLLLERLAGTSLLEFRRSRRENNAD